MALSATTYPVDESLKRPMTLSIGFHAALGAMLVVSTIYSHRGENWGGPGGAITVGLVGSVPGVPLPKPDVESASRVVDESKGLYKTEPKPKAPPPTDATPIPKFERNKPPKYVTRPSRVLENPAPPPENAVPYGGGGAPTVPYTSFSMGSGTQGGMGFSGAGGGNFGSKFPWYVEAVQRRVSSSWLQTTVDPGISTAPRAVVTFDILRDGSVANIQVMRSSGNSSVDTSAVRAIRASSPLERLPGEYSGSKVSVEFWFDFHR
jgi:periplasmic protein TonB